MFQIQLKLSGKKYWAESIWSNFGRAKDALLRAKPHHRKNRRITRINNQAELEQAEMESERLADWASD